MTKAERQLLIETARMVSAIGRVTNGINAKATGLLDEAIMSIETEPEKPRGSGRVHP